MRPKLREIARQAAVSEATVSRVLNARPGVAQATRDAVLAAVAELGGDPASVPAPSPARPDIAGLIVPELDNPVFPLFAQAVERRLSAHGLTTVLGTATIDGTQEHAYLRTMVERGTVGIVVVNGLNADTLADHAAYHEVVDQGVPLVLVNGAVAGLTVPVINADEAAGADMAARHLVDLGHERVGLAMGPRRYQPAQRMAEGFQRACERLLGGLDDALVCESLYSVEGGRLAGNRLLDAGASAIVTGSDLMALGVVRAARERGLEVPRDVSVVGYDDTPLIAYTDPPLTTVRQPVGAMGAAAATALLGRAGPQAEPGEYLFAPELVVRSSTGPRRAPRSLDPGRAGAPAASEATSAGAAPVADVPADLQAPAVPDASAGAMASPPAQPTASPPAQP